MEQIRLGVVGAGHLGRIHIKCLVEEGYADKLVFFDASASRRAEIVEEFGVTAVNTQAELWEATDAVILVTPTSTHHELALEGIGRDKHLFIEKPVTVDSAQGHELLRQAAGRNLVIQIGHVERFNPAFMAFEERGLSPKFIEAHRLATYNPRGTDVSVVMDLMIHDLDLLLYIVRSEVTDIQAVGVPLISSTADICNARLSFENGCVANVTASRISMKQMRKMRLFQKEAYATIDFIKKELQLFQMSDDLQTDDAYSFELDTQIGPKKISVHMPKLEEINAIKEEQKEFIKSITESKAPIVSLEDGVKAVELAERIMKEMKIQTEAWN